MLYIGSLMIVNGQNIKREKSVSKIPLSMGKTP